MSGPGQQHHRDARVVRRLEQCLCCGVVQLLVERFECLGPVEGDGADPVASSLDLQCHGSKLERVPLSASSSAVVSWSRRGRGTRAPTGPARPARRSAPTERGAGGPTYRHGRRPALARDPYAGGAGHAGRRAAVGRGRRPSAWREHRSPSGCWTRCRRCSAPGTTRPASSPRVRRWWSRPGAAMPAWRIGRAGLVMEALVPAVIEQKVTASRRWRGFGCSCTGTAGGARSRRRAPCLAAAVGRHVRQVPCGSLRMHVDPARSRALVSAARVADSLERTVGLGGGEVERRLTSLPGIGVWTAAEVRQRAHGHADAVSFSDYHVTQDVGWAVADAFRRRRAGGFPGALASAPRPGRHPGPARRPGRPRHRRPDGPADPPPAQVTRR